MKHIPFARDSFVHTRALWFLICLIFGPGTGPQTLVILFFYLLFVLGAATLVKKAYGFGSFRRIMMKLDMLILDDVPHRFTEPEFWFSFFGAPGVPPKGPRKLKFMEPIRVWYQVNTPGLPTPTIFVPPLKNQLMLWNVSDGPWCVCRQIVQHV